MDIMTLRRQRDRAVRLLRGVHADIEAMRRSDPMDPHGFAVDWNGASVEWPNLSICSTAVGVFLREIGEIDGEID